MSLLLLPASTVGLLGCGEGRASGDLLELTGSTMGTTYHVKIPARRKDPESDPWLNRLREEIDARLESVNQTMSTYRPDSDLSRFNDYRGTDWFAVPAALIEVLETAQTISRMTDGVFDVTVAPLVDLWGFGPTEGREAPPTDDQIQTLLERVGFRKLSVRADPPAVRKAAAELRVDLSAIAKGYAVDLVAELLERHGIADYLVEIGGDLRAKGRRPSGRPWRIAVERPDFEDRSVQRVIELGDRAMATSGDYRNFFEHDGRRYSHTLDPRTGRPVRHRLASVTVIADDCMTADGLATALLALGDQRGPQLAEDHQIAALFVLRTEQGLEPLASAGFRAVVDAAPNGD